MSPTTIEEVISKLEEIVNNAISESNNLGIFAQLYLGVTRKVRDGITAGRFEDGKRMERLDVLFANRYLEAYEAYLSGGQVSQAWKTAFDAAKNNNLLILQHLFMGMNAHINLDLGIAASRAVPPSQLPGLKSDFDEINAILISMVDEQQDKISQASPLLFLLDWFGQKSDEHLLEFSLRKARSQAWTAAVRLSKASSQDHENELIRQLDNYVAVLNNFITDPGILRNYLVKLVKSFEVRDPAKIVQMLS